MKYKKISVTEARRALSKHIKTDGIKIITKRKKPILVLMKVEEYDALIATLNMIEHDPEGYKKMMDSFENEIANAQE